MKDGLILLNMGGASNLDEVEIFLKNMFNDKNILTFKSKLLRKIIAFFIVKGRKKEACENYKKIGGGSPIVLLTKRLVEKLNASSNLHVEFSMLYTPPFASEVLERFSTFNRLFILPLYPHYSTTTVKSSLEDFDLHVEKFPNLHVIKIKEFYENVAYNELLIALIKKALKDDEAMEFDLIFSAHSLPQSIVDNGDPYQKQVKAHVKILKDLLLQSGVRFNATHLAYQSKLGPVKWLEPELGTKLEELKSKKVIICPLSFCIDNSETKFELCIEYKQKADELGFEEYRVCECPNDGDEFVEVIKGLVSKCS